MTEAKAILAEIEAEHERARDRWGAEHDEEHTVLEWVAYITQYTGRAVQAVEQGDAARAREELVKAGGLVVSCLRSAQALQVEEVE